MKSRQVDLLQTLLRAFAVIASTGCVTGSKGREEPQFLTIENMSPEDIRVYLDFGERQESIGTVMSMRRERLRLGPGSVPLSDSEARIAVEPIGLPGVFISAEQFRSVRFTSDWYAPSDLIRFVWRYSGNRVLMVGIVPCCDRQLNDGDPGPAISSVQASNYEAANRAASQLTRF